MGIQIQNVLVLIQNEGGFGKSLGRRGWISQYLPSFGGIGIFFLIIDPSPGTDQEIYHSRQGSIDSVKINASLPRMREWAMFECLNETIFLHLSLQFLYVNNGQICHIIFMCIFTKKQKEM